MSLLASNIPFCGFSICTLIGVVLTFRALRPRRRGDTPFCRECGYNLTGQDLLAEATCCSECGEPVSEPGAVVRGERRVRRGWAIVGIIMLLLGVVPLGAILYGHYAQVNWFRLKPAFWLVFDLHGQEAQEASTELESRRAAGKLSTAQISSWVDAALVEQVRVPPSSAVPQLIEDLLRLCLAGQLSPTQKERFLAAMFQQPLLKIRPRVVVGDPVPLELGYETSVPDTQLGFTFRVKLGEVNIDERLVSKQSHGKLVTFKNGNMKATSPLRTCDEPGRHKVRAACSFDVFLPGNQEQNDTPDWTRDLMVGGEFEAFAEAPPDLINLTRNATLDEWVVQNVKLDRLRYAPPDEAGNASDFHVVVLPKLPVNLAFNAVIESAGVQMQVGRFAFRAEDNPKSIRGNQVNFVLPTDMDLREMDILLICNPDAAKQDVEMYEVWGGSLRFTKAEIAKLLENPRKFDGPGISAQLLPDDVARDVMRSIQEPAE